MQERELKKHVDWVRDVAWAPNTGAAGNVIATCSEDRTVLKWSQRADGGDWVAEPVASFDFPVWRVSWSLAGSVLAVSAGDNSVTLWKETLDGKWMYVIARCATNIGSGPGGAGMKEGQEPCLGGVGGSFASAVLLYAVLFSFRYSVSHRRECYL